jgi:hypothetical protein
VVGLVLFKVEILFLLSVMNGTMVRTEVTEPSHSLVGKNASLFPSNKQGS